MTTSADEVIAKLQDMVQCPVCLEAFENPRMLPCQHSFCTKCLQGLLGPGRQIRCPYCNKEAPVPNGVRELPVDFRANTQLEILSEYERAKEAREAEAVAAEAVEPEEAAVEEEAVLGAEAIPPQDAFELMSLDERCPVCQEIPARSNNLSCGHSLCGNCVKFLLPVAGDTLHCPTCSRQIRIVRTSNTGLHTANLQSPADNSSDNVPLHQALYELLGGRSHQPASTYQSPNTAAEAGPLRPQPSVQPGGLFDGHNPILAPGPDGATSEGTNLSQLLLELLNRAIGAKVPSWQPADYPQGSSQSQEPSLPDYSRPAFLPPRPPPSELQHSPTQIEGTTEDLVKRLLRLQSGASQVETPPEESRLTFRSICGKNAVIHANQITAHRKDPKRTWYEAVLQTSRHLKPNELFEVRLDKNVDKWAGSMEIGVTTHSPTEAVLPRYIYDLGSGTWYMVGSKVWHKESNQWTVMNQNTQDLKKLKVGDRVGVQRRENGTLHFYINNVELVVAVSGVPAAVYGCINLIGKAAQVTITDTSGTHTGEAT